MSLSWANTGRVSLCEPFRSRRGDASAPAERRERAALDVTTIIQSFLAETNWRPARIKALAGALLYTKYNVLLRLVMKHIARQAGQDTDTSRDREFTDWAGLDDFIEEFIQHLLPRPPCLSCFQWS